MIRALALSTRVAFAISCNHFIYFLKKLPWLGKKIPDTAYQISTIKSILSILVEATRVLFGFLGAALSLAIFIFGPMFLLDRNLMNMDLFYHYFFFIYFLAAPFLNTIILQTRDMQAYTMINLLKLDKRDFFVSKVIFTLGIKTARYLLIFLLLSLFTNISVPESLMLSGYILFLALIWEYLLLKIYLKFKTIVYDKVVIVLASPALLLVICYLLPYRGIVLNLRGVLANGFLFVLTALLAGFSLWRLYSFDNYSTVTKETINRNKLLGIEDLLKNAAFADVNLAEEKLAQEEANGADDLQGYALFNHLFFTRHRRIIMKPVRTKVVTVTVLALLGWALLLLKPGFMDPVRENILSLSPYLIFFMYLLSSGERFSRALFFNCDRYMLKEIYYKDKEALLENFTVRLKKSISLNLAPAAAVAILLLGTGVIIGMGGAITRLLPMVVTIFSLSLFFSTHYLFIYYMLQPYTADLTQKSPLYSIVNILIYFISYGSIHIKTSSVVFTFAVMLFTLVYAAAAIVLTYNLAPKTFRLR